MSRGIRFLVGAVGMCAGIAACGGHRSPNQPTENPPTIACPAAPNPVESLDGSAQVVAFPAPTVTAGQPPLTTNCTPVSGAAFVVGTTTVTCTTSDAKARTASCTFSVVVQPPPTLTVTSFLAYGDSITSGDDGTAAAAVLATQHVFVQLPPGEPYPDVLQQELIARYRQQSPMVRNAGHPGELLSDGLTPSSVDCSGGSPNQSGAFQNYTRAISTAQYGALLLMEGSNDVNDSGGDSCLLGKAINVLRAIIEDAKGRGIRVVMATIPPMVPPGSRAEGYANVPVYDDKVRALANSEAVPLADVYTAFGSDAPMLIGFDGLHPNPDGYKRIADTFFATIKSSLEAHDTTSRVKRVR